MTLSASLIYSLNSHHIDKTILTQTLLQCMLCNKDEQVNKFSFLKFSFSIRLSFILSHTMISLSNHGHDLSCSFNNSLYQSMNNNVCVVYVYGNVMCYSTPKTLGVTSAISTAEPKPLVS